VEVQPQKRCFAVSDSVSPKIVNSEMRTFGQGGPALEDDCRRIGLRGPEDRLREARDAWVCCENITPIAEQTPSLFRRSIARKTTSPERTSCNPGFAVGIPRQVRLS
jgi:hypothetical protein